ncbi:MULTISPECIES: sensor histidine kinase [Anaerostipes]|uniref:sensor histidine kinase n=1 Tax=Anaerostipes TaxID=207244 RepID=UPI001E564049|nr:MULTISPECIES: HAMP domain-containing sensor histidine kinase [Anaerostipes]MCI5622638.1 HAMP domain-containing histidine kinase [Anaerostipes sp.]MDY2725763.1 HAMP domain-containing sensor histidine kinase [Anaerostipes faecalis]
MKNQSIKIKMTLMLIIIMTVTILMSILINLTMLKPYYILKEKKNITSAYEEIQSLFQKDTVKKEEIDQVARKYNYRVLISDPVNQMIYSSEDERGVMYKDMKNILKNFDRIQSQVEKKGYAVTTISNKSSGTGINLIGYLDGQYTVILNTPMESIKTSAALSGRFTAYVGIMLIIASGIAMYIYSKNFTEPIEEMARVANRMSNLDFDVRVKPYGEDEIGKLGNSLNDLSGKLEMTISELKTANNELQKDIEQKIQIDEMRKEFLSHVSHELKTPIALIQGYSEGLKDNIFDDEESKNFYCDVIADEAQKMNRMVQKLMTLNQIEFGNNQVEMERFNISELIQNMVDSNKILLEKDNVSIVFNEGPVTVWADEFMIEEVVSNYLSNARNHVSENGVIQISYCYHGDNLRVKVFNSGKHIPEEDLDKLWIKFYKVDKARTREYGGSGVGLSIVEATMKAHGKDYGVSNISGGVEFYFEVELDKNNIEG